MLDTIAHPRRIEDATPIERFGSGTLERVSDAAFCLRYAASRFAQFVIDSPSSGARTLGTHIMFVPWFGKKKQFFN